MTIPFFGAGVVELPPEGFKRAKNSRKMQMVFFVHEGKVLVEVGAMGLEVNSFALSKGGVWIVPRGKLPTSLLSLLSSPSFLRNSCPQLPRMMSGLGSATLRLFNVLVEAIRHQLDHSPTEWTGRSVSDMRQPPLHTKR